MNDKISNKNKKDWDEFVLKKERVPNKDFVEDQLIKRQIRSIDLHGFTLQGANNKIENFITESYNRNFKKLIVVTGKGLHSTNETDPYVSKNLRILKYSVPHFIRGNKNLMKMIIDIRSANMVDGGDGAMYIFLKNSKK